MTDSIPIVDLSADRATVVSSLIQAYETYGFASVVGHGVPAATVDAAFDASRSFHAMSLDDKMRIELDDRHRGYIPIGVSTDRTSSVETATVPNQSASFMMMREDAAASPDVVAGTYLAGSNQWPELVGFRPAIEAYHGAMADLGARIVGLMAEGLGDDSSLETAFDTPTTWLRLLHYPPRPDSTAGVYGSAPHRDFGCITLLAQDDVGGLAVRSPGGEWLDVPPRPDAFVMNVGDMLHRWSNGRLQSTAHRVTNRAGRARFSVAFFYDPHMSTIIEPLAGCISETHPSRFEPITFGDFVRSQLEASYDQHAR